jgi:hypothetical protein
MRPREESDLEMHTEPLVHNEKRSSGCLRRIESAAAFTGRSAIPKSVYLGLDF